MSFLISVFSRFVRLFCVAIGDLLIQYALCYSLLVRSLFG
ncbi:unnamed protein product [Brassica oleracea]|uniref:(rape) hypothetical protein n=1 Tax=Brassica napus TaxID=3708 RepID=A0A816V8C0_BRANA|nr:unnamed protein product [Brassica napus]